MHSHRSFHDMPRKQAASKQEGFAERLRSLRTQRNLSQTKLGELVETHYTHIGRYERGTSRPSADTLNRMAQALGVSTDYLLEGNNEQAACARFEDRQLLERFQEIQQLGDDDKRVMIIFLDAFLAKKKIQRLVS